jgi:predicted nucleic acid-binding protein
MPWSRAGGFELVYTPKTDFDAGRSLFGAYDRLSLTDAVIAASMDRRGIEYLYSFDDGFDGVEGVTRLVTTENPSE